MTRRTLTQVPLTGRTLTGRKGFSIVEAILLMIVMAVAFAAIFQTVFWAQRNHSFSRRDRDSREVLFSWAETFESVWPTQEAADNPGNATTLEAEAGECVETVGNLLGAYSGGAARAAQVGGFNVTVTNIQAVPAEGKIDLTITIGTTERSFISSLRRSFNIYKASGDFYTSGGA